MLGVSAKRQPCLASQQSGSHAWGVQIGKKGIGIKIVGVIAGLVD
jgi:hypothetical protein